MSAPTPEHWAAAAKNASLGVGHIWTAVRCPAYRSLDPGDCTCRACADPIAHDDCHPDDVCGT